MRTLKFIIEGQTIRPDPECDFSGLVPGSNGYLKAQFKFSKEWNGCVKVLGTWSRLGFEFPPVALERGDTVDIPTEALENKYFKIQVIGKRRDGLKLATNKLEICQNGG